MSQGYAILVKDFKKAMKCFDEIEKKELLQYVPMGDNYCIQFHGCDKQLCGLCSIKKKEDYDHRTLRQFNKLECVYIENNYYHNTLANMEEQFNRTHPPIVHNVIVDQKTFEKLKRLMRGADPYKLIDFKICTIDYKKCMYDSSKEETYEFKILTHHLVKFLDSSCPKINQWLNTVAIKGYTVYEKKDEPFDSNSYESLYMSTKMTIRQHVEMFKRDSKQCNYNTVYYGTQYGIIMSQSQFDMLRNNEIKEYLCVCMEPVASTNAIISMGERESLYNRFLDPYFDSSEKKKSNNCLIL